ncbi:MAG: molybdenum ABC transporter ATP-binding protein [Cypionkella sp.]|nr:molybdenum ABC transporter ATP-binding protein [Cypionkella sp.]
MSLSVTLSHRFPGFVLNVDFTAPKGLTALFGASGSGKTTVINAVAGLLRPGSGHIATENQTLLDTRTGTNLPPHRRRLGYVFQEGRLFPHLTIRQNLLYGRWFQPKSPDRFDEIIDMLGIAPLLSRRPAGLSGGEKQRTAIGRALLSNPQILLMDEPLAALDDARKAEILPYIERLRDTAQIPILYVSHSMPEVARLATHLVVLENGQSIRSGPVGAVLADPAIAAALGWRGAGAVLHGTVIRHDSDGIAQISTPGGDLYVPNTAALGARLRIRIASQDIILSRHRPEGLSALNILSGEISDIQTNGPSAYVQIRCGTDLVLAQITRRSAEILALAPGQTIFAIVKTVSVAPVGIGAD